MNIQQPASHLDHLLRQTRMNQLQLSQMADVKANMLLTLASVVVTLCLRYLTDPLLRWTATVFILFSLLTVLLAAYAVMPKTPLKIRHGEHPDVHSPRFSLLFFANFLANEKYRYSRLAYLPFIVGLAASGLVAVVSGVLR
ncbi:MAG: hypothetical protein COZ06_39055 [Armatimonadetes bacterium CG_4_10_14_3_um_filter_66_18]|nr:hypothetical protein [Armatimonadota bacterium]OIO96168.1 MAG: hypothetical protein AUJ96_25385 [Armatimonadetes bacterium CG2_30_66_41]PIU87883.1 MAG: hypothetical protein COS65_32550 [Armatimonadetes bacterium CG06_land_8_20_14_3_00_66_21]PIW15906.1 MAG: hypothetical protein COW34_06280 [Armatimonadetes bacterium CG17_big_fil_post_rev_8_21_14_2_50_66_6]PIY35043.1 MAG: hypothetical protein COZ06_39055 [Armatimonadetes bacterium CG_4_10_14_3_um_filter_66_18]PIZ49982.1 MAG: hypothetical prot